MISPHFASLALVGLGVFLSFPSARLYAEDKMESIKAAQTAATLATTVASTLSPASCGAGGDPAQVEPEDPLDRSQKKAQYRKNGKTDKTALEKAYSVSDCSDKNPLIQLFKDHQKNHAGDPGIKHSPKDYAHYLGMSGKESGGRNVSMTFFNTYEEVKSRGGDSMETYLAIKEVISSGVQPGNDGGVQEADRSQLMVLASKKGGENKFDHQLNFGMLQMSADRLSGKHPGGSHTKENTVTMKSYFDTAKTDPAKAITDCGAQYFFDPDKTKTEQLLGEFKELALCTPGNDSPEQIGCFGRWAVLCPNFNLTMALRESGKYFESWDTPGVCESVFSGGG